MKKYFQKKIFVFKSAGLLSMALASTLLIPKSTNATLTQAQKDSGWVDIYNGKDFTGLYTYLVVPPNSGKPDIMNNHNYDNDPNGTFKAENGMIHGINTTTQGHIGTRKDYQRYHCRVEYRFVGTNGSTNAGFLYHLDTSSFKLFGQHPRSVECQMKHNEMGWAFLIANVWMTSYVDKNTFIEYNGYQYKPQAQGGTLFTQGDREPNRVIRSADHTEHFPPDDTLWNTEDIWVYGSDSANHVVNGKLVLKGTNLQYDLEMDNVNTKVPLAKGKIGVQAEGHEVWYRNWQVMELDANNKPVTAIRNSKKNTKLVAPSLVVLSTNSKTHEPVGVKIWNGESLQDIQGRKEKFRAKTAIAN